uniref:Uncharacterized protein n=1 Tax=Oryza brachyantha TaxID=4533 RepID=J3LR20_ORYBR
QRTASLLWDHADYRHQLLYILNKFIDVRIHIFWMQMYEDSCYVKTDFLHTELV